MLKQSIFSLILSALVLVACNKSAETTSSSDSKSESTETGKYAKIIFEEGTFDFGKIKQGDIVKHTFAFKNESDEPLVISSAQASCGCTIPSYPKEPVSPGESGKIDVQFNSTGKQGVQNKSITITANTMPNITTILLKGEVLMADSTKK